MRGGGVVGATAGSLEEKDDKLEFRNRMLSRLASKSRFTAQTTQSTHTAQLFINSPLPHAVSHACAQQFCGRRDVIQLT